MEALQETQKQLLLRQQQRQQQQQQQQPEQQIQSVQNGKGAQFSVEILDIIKCNGLQHLNMELARAAAAGAEGLWLRAPKSFTAHKKGAGSTVTAKASKLSC